MEIKNRIRLTTLVLIAWVSVHAQPQASNVEIFKVNEVEFTMVRVEGGTFQMGSDSGYQIEKPIHEVKLNSFSLGQTEVTQELWEAVMGSNPSSWSGKNLPVEKVTWEDCQTFITKLNQATGKKFRLPTEAEWEYAARGGNQSKGYTYSGSNNIDDVAWYRMNSGSKTQEVGTKAPNELGLYDMSGNVNEWCQDWYDENYYSSSPVDNPTGPTSGSRHVVRGGYYDGNTYSIYRVTCRNSFSSMYTSPAVGFRLAL